MKKIVMTVLGISALLAFESHAQETEKPEKKEIPTSGFATEADQPEAKVEQNDKKELNGKLMKKNGIHTFKVNDINGKEFDMGSLKGKKVLIVNTASNCGYTPQYKELEELSQQMKGKLVVIGFPANDFGNQEPGTNKEIATFCQKNYGVTFPMMEKITVTGDKIHPLYAYLTQKSQNGLMDSNVEWNFQKYLIDENGKLVKMFPSKVKPLGEEMMAALK